MPRDGWKWKDGERQTVSTAYLYRRLKDGSIETWEIEKVRIIDPKKTAIVGQYGIIRPAPEACRPYGEPIRRHYYGFDQMFYMKGDTLHVNGRSVSCFEETKVKNVAKLRAAGFRSISEDRLSDLRTKVLAPWMFAGRRAA